MMFWEYVRDNAIRGDCVCGMCIDAPFNPKQPSEHTIDMAFFKVAKSESANADDFKNLVEEEFPHWLDGEEHNYIQMGSEIGDQGLAIMAIALGHLLGIWKAITPAMMGLPDELAKQMAGMGLLSMQCLRGENDV